MFDLILDLARLLISATLGMLAIFLVTVSIRTFFSGASAYETNRKVSPRRVVDAMNGTAFPVDRDAEGRLSHGLAINVKTGELKDQRRLSDEALDDVIGRSA